MASKRPPDDALINDRPQKRGSNAQARRFSPDTYRPLYFDSARTEDARSTDISRPSSGPSTPKSDLIPRGPKSNGYPPHVQALHDSSTDPTSTPYPNPANLLAALLTLTSELGVARLREEAVKEEVARYEKQCSDATAIHSSFPTFLENSRAALAREQGDLAEKRKVINGLVERQARIIKEYTAALGFSQVANREEDTDAKIDAKVKERLAALEAPLKALVESKDDQIKALEARVTKQEEISRKAQIELAATTKNIKADVEAKDIETRRILGNQFIDQAKTLDLSLQEKLESFTVKRDLEGVLGEFKLDIERLEIKSEQMRTTSDMVSRHEGQIITLNDGAETLTRAVKDMGVKIGDDDFSGLYGGIKDLETRINRIEQDLHSSHAPHHPDTDGNDLKEFVSAKTGDLQEFVRTNLQRLTTQFEAQFATQTSQMQEDLESIEQRFKDYSTKVSNAVETQSQDLEGLRVRLVQQGNSLDVVEQQLPNLTLRLEAAEVNLQTHPPTGASSTRDGVLDLQSSGVPQRLEQVKELEVLVKKIQNEVVQRLEVVEKARMDVEVRLKVQQEATKNLEDRYNNTTTETVVAAMAHQLKTRYGCDPNQRNVNTQIRSELLRIQTQVNEAKTTMNGLSPGVTQLQDICRAMQEQLQKLQREFSNSGNSSVETLDARLGGLTKELNGLQLKAAKAQADEIAILKQAGTEIVQRLDDIDATLTATENAKIKAIGDRMLVDSDQARLIKTLQDGLGTLMDQCKKLQTNGATKTDIDLVRADIIRLDDLLHRATQAVPPQLINVASNSSSTHAGVVPAAKASLLPQDPATSSDPRAAIARSTPALITGDSRLAKSGQLSAVVGSKSTAVSASPLSQSSSRHKNATPLSLHNSPVPAVVKQEAKVPSVPSSKSKRGRPPKGEGTNSDPFDLEDG